MLYVPESRDDRERAQQPTRVRPPAARVQLEREALHHRPEARAKRDAHAEYREERARRRGGYQRVEEHVGDERRAREKEVQ